MGEGNKNGSPQQDVASLTQFKTRLAPLTDLEGVLPLLLRNLSLGRAQIAIDHVRGAIATNTPDRIVFLVLCSRDDPETPVAAAIAIQQPGSTTIQTGDMATIVHAGFLTDISVDHTISAKQSEQMMRLLASEFDDELASRGVRFLQWATDVSQTLDESVGRSCQSMGFQAIGTLDYLSGVVPNSEPSPNENAGLHPLRFQTIDWDDMQGLRRFTDLVQSTYEHTLDCPRIADFRNADQTLSGYRSASAFDGDLWFTAVDDQNVPIGCVILAKHVMGAADDSETPPIIEVVYMGLIPQARGRGRGEVLMRQAVRNAVGLGASRIILAVDRMNTPARAIYDSFGLQPMLCETVWVKLVGLGKEAASLRDARS